MRPVFLCSSRYYKNRADVIRYIKEHINQPMKLTKLTGCLEMEDNNSETDQMLSAFMGASEQMSDLKATMVAKFDAQEKQLCRLEKRQDSMSDEVTEIKTKVFNGHDKAILELEEDGKDYITRREFENGMNRIRTTVDSYKWGLALVLVFASGLGIPMFLRFMGWA